jgi:hypothetical protein
MFGTFKLVMVGILVSSLAGAGLYVMKLRSDNAILKANQIKLEEAVASQQELIEQQKADFETIMAANEKLQVTRDILQKELQNLDDKFNKTNASGKKRDIEEGSVKQLEVFKTEVPRTKLDLPDPETPRIQDLNWIIITSENADEVFAKLKEQNIDPVLFGLTDDDYETLAVNFAQIRAYMIKQKLTLDQYREYYEAEKTIADK